MKKRLITILLCVTMTVTSVFPVLGDEIPVEEVIVEEGISDETIPEENISDEIILDESVSEEAIPEGNTSDAVISDESIPEVIVSEETITEDGYLDDDNENIADGTIYSSSEFDNVVTGTEKVFDLGVHPSANGGIRDNDGISEDGTVLPATYNPLVDGDYIVPLMDQGNYGCCWAVGTMSVAEIEMAKKGLAGRTEVDYSEKALIYFINNKDGKPVDKLGGFDGDNCYRADRLWWNGNNPSYAGNFLMGWVGITDESKAPFSEMPVLDESGQLVEDKPLDNSLAFDDVAHVTDKILVSKENRDAVKQLLMQNGAATIQYYAYNSNDTYIPGMAKYCETGKEFYYHKKDEDGNILWGSYYNPVPGMNRYINHTNVIIGWDDNFSKDNFNANNEKPKNDGAWLVRNSWTTDDTKKMSYLGYFWMSYEDKGLYNDIVFLNVESADDSADNIYQYDGVPIYSYWGNTNIISYANVYTVKANQDGELLRSVAYDADDENVDYSIDIYMNPDLSNNDPREGLLVGHQEGRQLYYGYHTVDLDEPVPLSEGDTYSIVVTLKSTSDEDEYLVVNQEGWYEDFWLEAEIGLQPKQSFSWDNDGWIDNNDIDPYLSDGSICKIGNNKIKGFTDNSSTYSIKYHSNDGSGDVKSQSAVCGSEFALQGKIFDCTGKVQTGWNTAADGSGTDYSFEEAVNLSDTVGETINLYAQWKVANQHNTLKYDANGGTDKPEDDIVYVDFPNTKTVFEISDTEPTRKGYSFDGWYTAAVGGEKVGTTIEVGSDNCRENQEITIYAHWTIIVYKISYILNGGNNVTNPTEYTVETDTIVLGKPTKRGYRFDGWNDGEKKIDRIEKGSTGDITLSAEWKMNHDYAAGADIMSVSSDDDEKTEEESTPSGSTGNSNNTTASTDLSSPLVFRYDNDINVSIQKQEQGIICKAAFALGRPSGYVEAFSINMLVKGKCTYDRKAGSLVIYIPNEYRKAGRTFALVGVDKFGSPKVFYDTDTSDATITVNLDIQGYAFDIVYKDTATAGTIVVER